MGIKDPERFDHITSGIQNIAVAVALLLGGAWAVVEFTTLGKSSEASDARKLREAEMRGSIALSVETDQIESADGNYSWVAVTVTASNGGKEPQLLEFSTPDMSEVDRIHGRTMQFADSCPITLTQVREGSSDGYDFGDRVLPVVSEAGNTSPQNIRRYIKEIHDNADSLDIENLPPTGELSVDVQNTVSILMSYPELAATPAAQSFLGAYTLWPSKHVEVVHGKEVTLKFLFRVKEPGIYAIDFSAKRLKSDFIEDNSLDDDKIAAEFDDVFWSVRDFVSVRK